MHRLRAFMSMDPVYALVRVASRVVGEGAVWDHRWSESPSLEVTGTMCGDASLHEDRCVPACGGEPRTY